MQKFSWVLPKKDGEISKEFDLQKTLFVNVEPCIFLQLFFAKYWASLKNPSMYLKQTLVHSNSHLYARKVVTTQ